MSTATRTPVTTSGAAAPATGPAPAARGGARADLRRPPFGRLVAVELRKMFDTRAGWWLCASVVIASVVASAAITAFAPAEEQTYETFATAIGAPMAVILPVLAILSITAEWSQRTGLATFTMVPARSRVIGAKATVILGIGVASTAVAVVVGALGTLVGSLFSGNDPVWDASPGGLVAVMLGNVTCMAVGFMLGVVLRNSPAAIVGYFVYGFVLAGLSMSLAAYQQWWADVQPWLDFNHTQGGLFEGLPDAEGWAQLGTSGLLWLVVPTALGLWTLRRAEVK